MTKREQLEKLLADQDQRAQAKRQEQPKEKPGPRAPHPDDGRSMDRASGREFMLVKNIIPDVLQPRKEFDPVLIDQIGASIKQDGQLQPLVVFWSEEESRWVIEDGEQRWMGAKAHGVERLWCMFSQKKTTPAERLKRQLMSACLRADLKDVERANAIKRLMDLTGCTQQQAADDLHMSQASVSKSLKLLELSPEIQAEIIAGKIPPDVGVELAKLDAAEQADIHGEYLSGNMTRDDVSEVVKAKKRKGRKPSKIATFKSNGNKGVLTLKRTATVELTRAFLVEWLESLAEESQAAA